MSNRWFRLLLAVVALAAAAAAAYRVVEHEQRLSQTAEARHAIEAAAETCLVTLGDLRAALHAYVAPGQNPDFWVARSALLIDRLRASLLALEAASAPSETGAAESLDVVDRVAAGEQRIRQHVRAGQTLLASDVIFSDMRDLLDRLRLQILQSREQALTASDVVRATTREQQMQMLAAGAGVLAMTLLLLVRSGRGRARESQAPDAPAASATLDRPLAAEPATPDGPSEPPASASATRPDLDEAAALCRALACVSDSGELPALLSRAAALLEARGLIVWLSSSGARELHPVAASGYDERLLARLGPLPADAANMTAQAFRSGASRTSGSGSGAAAAIAVPLHAPGGTIGVVSAELQDGVEPTPGAIALAEILAAQLAGLIGSLPAAPPTREAQQA